MKIALVCDDLTQHGGHEKVILEVTGMFPDVPLYTTCATQNWLEICKQNNIELRTSFLQKLPFKKALNRFYSVFLLHILALENFNFDKYDVVLSLSSRFAHGIITKPHTTHICYMSTVGRMFWEPNTYFENESFRGSFFIKKLAMLFLKFPLSYIRLWDKTASNRVDYHIANSKITQQRIKKYYNQDSVIINPPVNVIEFGGSASGLLEKKDPYFLILTRLAPWKKVDIAIEACKKVGVNLKIVGEGPDIERLKTLVQDLQPNCKIEFLGRVSEEEKIILLKNCVALINTQYEDFGIVPVEAMACGKPVIAYARGGALETVKEGVTGEFFYQQTSDELAKVLQSFDKAGYDPQICINQAKKYDVGKFQESLRKFVKDKLT